MTGGHTALGRDVATREARESASIEALRIVFEISMIRPEIEEVAGEVWEQANNVMHPGAMGWTADQALSSYLDAWTAFREAARADLRPELASPRRRLRDWLKRKFDYPRNRDLPEE